ncbi:hypothetical protein CEXT_623521 [Caerostris extrusa]|uniref:Uncharacterized protein n=1 Tax=Caerostris extrusa TaxID=172846 RepID=A0AAV4UJJ4_CAEEX|nr:hypothetical protein CEXT_623521 [Caerostris extrusa]
MHFIPIRRVLDEFRFAINENPNRIPHRPNAFRSFSPNSYSPRNGMVMRSNACRKSHLIYRIGKMRIDSLAVLYSKHAQPIPPFR